MRTRLDLPMHQSILSTSRSLLFSLNYFDKCRSTLFRSQFSIFLTGDFLSTSLISSLIITFIFVLFSHYFNILQFLHFFHMQNSFIILRGQLSTNLIQDNPITVHLFLQLHLVLARFSHHY